MTILITGAAGGIGSATASAFEAIGQDVIRHDIAPADRIDVTGDLMDAATLDTMRRACSGRGVDAVIAAHGAAGAGELSTIDAERVRRTMRVNTVSVLRLFDVVRDELVRTDGAFIAVSSQAGLEGEAQNGVYSASKSALIGWAQGLAARATSPKLRIICPGMTETRLLVAGLTGMAASAGVTYEEFLARRLEELPSRRLGRPEEVGRAIVWLSQLQTRGAVVAAITGGETFE